MNLSDCRLNIGDACFRWEDESPMRKRNRLAQREYRKRKRRAARPESDESDRKTEPPPPTRAVLQSCGTGTSLTSTAQPAVPSGNPGLCLNGPDQVSPVQASNVGYSRDNTIKAKSAHPREEAPARFPTVKYPGEHSHLPPVCGARHGAEHIDLETREYLWPEDQVLHTSSPACVDLHAPVGSLVGSVSSPMACGPPLPACVATGVVGPMGNVGERLHQAGISRDPLHDVAVTPASPKDHFGMVLNTCEAAGFPSIQTEYYSVSLGANSSLAATQSPRKPPDLLDLPDHHYVASSPWTHQREDAWPLDESMRFREQMLRIAENMLTSEVGQLGVAPGDQSTSVAPVSVEQRNGTMGTDGNSTASRRGIEAAESLKS